MSKILYLISFILATYTVQAHYYLTSINGKSQCRRKLFDPLTYNDMSPLTKEDFGTEAMICNKLGMTPAPETCPIAAGEAVALKWTLASHLGPCAVYLAPAASQGKGDVWFKIFDLGFKGGKWCSQVVEADGNTMRFTIPAGIPSGKYILRADLTGFHIPKDPQVYGTSHSPCLSIFTLTPHGSRLLRRGDSEFGQSN